MKCIYCGNEMDISAWEMEFENISYKMHSCPHCRAIVETYEDDEGVFKELWLTYINGHRTTRLRFHDCLGNQVDTYI